MMRRLFATLLMTALAGVLTLRAADEPSKAKGKPPADKKDEASLDPKGTLTEAEYQQARLKMQFDEFKNQLIRLADRLAQSSDPANKDKAKILREAINKVNDVGVEIKFEKLVNLIKNASKDVSIDDLANIQAQHEDLTKDIRAIIAILLTDNRDAELRRKIKDLERRIAELKKIIGKEERISDRARVGKSDGDHLAKDQKGVTNDTKDLAGVAKGDSGKEGKGAKGDPKGAGKTGDGKKGEPKEDAKEAKAGDKEPKGGDKKPGDSKDIAKKGDPNSKEADAKDGKKGDPSDAKAGGKKSDSEKADSQSASKGRGDGKGAPKPGSKPGESSASKSNSQGGQGGESSAKAGGKQPPPQQDPQQPPSDLPGQKKIQEGIGKQEQAETKLPKDQKDGADKVDQAVKDFKEVLKKWEELLKQLREEEVERILAALQAQCERMLALQIQVRDGTVSVDKVIQESADKKPTRAEDQKALELSDREEEIVRLAEKALGILRDEGSAVAFPEVFVQIRDDMINVARRLRKTDTGSLTVTIENDIIATLREMIEALKRARQENGKQPPSKGGGGGPQNQKLIDLIAELKMIRSMQIRVNARTQTYAREYEGEQAPAIVEAQTPQEKEKAETLTREMKELAQRQQKIFEVANNIYKEKNK
ncbi:MAG: hypothetical protein ACJ8FY_03525 [Gemmataceae bacterium]